MGAVPPVYSSVSGPAKWAAVIALSFACGGGLVYSVMREPRPARVPPAPVKELPARPLAQASPLPALLPKSLAAQPEPAAVTPAPPIDPMPTPAPPPQAEPAALVPEATPLQTAPEPPPASSVARKINLNKATQAELELLPRVGPATAKAILSYRALNGPFRSVQDLDKVKGIGPKTMERLAPLVSVE
jgi:competence protein ComEA